MVRKHWLKGSVCVLLAIATLAAYAPVGKSQFISLDDMDYVMNNPPVQQGLSWSAVKWAFVSFHSSNWHPLTWLSHMLDCQLYGLNPTGPHLTNLALHVANTLLLFILLQQLTSRLWPSAFVALLFALHPMHVESVAWVSERKDVLSAFFFLLTLLCYAKAVTSGQPSPRFGTAGKWPVTQTETAPAPIRSRVTCPPSLFYWLALMFFALGLMAKPMLVTLPCVLCLLDYWPLARFQLPLKRQPLAVLRRLAVEKIPFFILTALSCWMTWLAQNSLGAVKPLAEFPLDDRLAHVPVAYGWYVLKLFWPSDLSVFYMLHTDYDSDTVAGASLLLLVMTLFAVWRARKQPYLLVGWLWFVGMLVPVVGLLQVGNQAYADRYTYLPYIGLFIIIAWGIPALLAKWLHRRAILLAAALLASAACGFLTVAQVRLWQNGQTLFERALALDPGNEEAWALLGLTSMNQGNADKAIACLRRATTINYMYYQAWHDLAGMLFLKGNYAEAQDAYEMALRYTRNKVEIYDNLGDLFMATGRYGDAIANFQSSLALAPDQPAVQTKLGQSLVLDRQPDRAAMAYQNAIRLHPDSGPAQLGLAMILASTGHDAEAIAHYRLAIQLNTNSVIALNNLAWLLATDSDPRLRNGPEAVALAEHACKLTKNQNAFFIGTLAAAYAEAGRFHDAAATAQKAHDVALAQGQKEIAADNERLIELFKSGQAFRAKAKTSP
ncbi:MAG: tetratricopeptide repeat protein [Verrucomicrobiota bacterium]